MADTPSDLETAKRPQTTALSAATTTTGTVIEIGDPVTPANAGSNAGNQLSAESFKTAEENEEDSSETKTDVLPISEQKVNDLERTVSFAPDKLIPDGMELKTFVHQLPANISCAAGCVLWSGHFDGDKFSGIRRLVMWALLLSSVLQTLCLGALTYFVYFSSDERPRRAAEWIVEIPEGKEVSILFFACFVMVGVIVVRRECHNAWTQTGHMDWTWFKERTNAGSNLETSRFWTFLIRSYPILLADFGGYAYMMVLCTRFDAYADDQDYLEYVLNLLAFDFVFEIDDWFFGILRDQFKLHGLWKDDYLEVTAKGFVATEFKRKTTEITHAAIVTVLNMCFFAGYCVCSRIAFVCYMTWTVYFFVGNMFGLYSKKTIWAVHDINIFWMAFLLTVGAFCVLHGDDSIVPFVCYSFGAVFFVVYVVLRVYKYQHMDQMYTWFLEDKKTE